MAALSKLERARYKNAGYRVGLEDVRNAPAGEREQELLKRLGLGGLPLAVTRSWLEGYNEARADVGGRREVAS